jgi:hypothetical protein
VNPRLLDVITIVIIAGLAFAVAYAVTKLVMG